MDDVAEQQEIANEISEAISNPVGFGQDADEVRWYRVVRVWSYTKSFYILSTYVLRAHQTRQSGQNSLPILAEVTLPQLQSEIKVA